jgi:predicted SprT family Zn-dependent metalloprotease
MTITTTQYHRLDEAYCWFNRDLFDGQLPDCLITLNRSTKARGYFIGKRFRNCSDQSECDEIALNPDEFEGRSALNILSTLVHEMAHQWQAHHGEASRSGYHNAEWASRMEAVGLMPSSTGEPGGKRTGQAMSHYIIQCGRFEISANTLLKQLDAPALIWQSRPHRRASAERNKARYCCPACSAQAWGKPLLQLICGACMIAMQSDMTPET